MNYLLLVSIVSFNCQKLNIIWLKWLIKTNTFMVNLKFLNLYYFNLKLDFICLTSELYKIFKLSNDVLYSKIWIPLKLKDIIMPLDQMLWQFLLVIAFLLIVASYFLILKPALVYKKYVTLLPSLGYKVLIHPFRPMGAYIR